MKLKNLYANIILILVMATFSSCANSNGNDTPKVTTGANSTQTIPDISLSISSNNITENGGSSSIIATATSPYLSDIVVNLSFSGTAIKDTDFSSSSSITISAGTTSSQTTLTAINNTIIQGNKTVIITVSTITNGIDNSTSQTITIAEDDIANISLSVNNTSINEGGGVAMFTTTTSNKSTSDITVNLDFTKGTAMPSTNTMGDFNISASSITILAGSTTGSINVYTINDLLWEASETIVVDIVSVIGGSENGTQSKTTTIIDNDLPFISLSVDNITISENASIATFTATTPYKSTSDMTVNLGFTGTATLNTDYTISASSMTIIAGSTTASINVYTSQDTTYEGNETIIVDILSVIGGFENAVQSKTSTIKDDDIILMWATTPPSLGNLKGAYASARIGADTYCANSSAKPAGAKNIHAFISISAIDEIRDMPTLYGYNVTHPIMDASQTNIFSNNWSTLVPPLNVPSQTMTLEAAGILPTIGTSRTWYSGSNKNGSIYLNNCNGFTNNTTSFAVAEGRNNALNDWWIRKFSSFCNANDNQRILCIGTP